MVTGRGRQAPGARSSRPASSRPSRSRTTAASVASVAKAASARAADKTGKQSKTSKSDKAASKATVVHVAGWRGHLNRVSSNRRTKSWLLMGAAVVFLFILVGPTLKAYVGQRQQIAQLREQVAAQEVRVEDLQAEQARWQDPAYVEQQARQRLKFVKVGEKAYTVLDPKDTKATAPGMAEADRSSAWYVTVWDSLGAADAPAASQ